MTRKIKQKYAAASLEDLTKTPESPKRVKTHMRMTNTQLQAEVKMMEAKLLAAQEETREIRINFHTAEGMAKAAQTSREKCQNKLSNMSNNFDDFARDVVDLMQAQQRVAELSIKVSRAVDARTL